MEIIEVSGDVEPFEWRTAALAAAIYGLWFALTYGYESLPVWALFVLGLWTVAWHLNLQHEMIHGHPTRVSWVNTLIGCWPLALWLPYDIYFETHMRHHNEPILTDPLQDPESNYLTSEQWARLGPIRRALVEAHATLAGRVILGPAVAAFRLWRAELAKIRSGDARALRGALIHLAEVAVVLYWVLGVCHMPLWLYVIAFAYPGTGLALVRSFAEHRADPDARRRTAIIEHAPLLGVLFLHNNLHVAHHLRPGLPWHRLPEFYRRNRAALIERNGGLVYRSYFDIARAYLFRPQDRVVHPQRAGGR